MCDINAVSVFLQNERVTYEEFKEWLLIHSDATTVTCWLLAEPCHVSLSNDLETPTFYQTLAGVTHCMLSIVTHFINLLFELRNFFSINIFFYGCRNDTGQKCLQSWPSEMK